MTEWRDYWAKRNEGGHRSQNEGFLAKEAAEKLFHLGTGGALLDFGCGSADLLVYYAASFTRAVGADFSPAMLAAARERSVAHDRALELVEADDVSVWDRVAGSFDRITTAGVVQYLTTEQLTQFLRSARTRLNAGGKVVLFDVIDPRIHTLSELDLFAPRSTGARVRHAVAYGVGQVASRLRGTTRELGHRYPPYELVRIAEICGFRVEIVWSMYYEYRFHALLDPT